MALSPLLGIGASALGATQAAINVTGGNIANVNTEGYSRQTTRFADLQSVDFVAGQLGRGVRVSEIYRNFNRFMEDSYLDRSSTYSRWNEQQSILQSVQSLFNEANTSGIGYALGEFFGGWQDLSLRPDDIPSREALLSNSETLANLIRSAKEGLDRVQTEMDMYIEQSVEEINGLVKSIQKLNQQIGMHDVPGVSNANALKDERDMAVRKLADLIDIEVSDKGGADFTIRSKAGFPLLEGLNTYTLETAPTRVENALKPDSKYEGTMEFEGTDSHEYTFEVVNAPKKGAAGTADTPGTMRVSLDGGRTWLRNDDGTELQVQIPTDPDQRMKVKDLYVSFDADPSKLSAGDRFEVIPKNAVYFNSPTRPPTNVTPRSITGGEDDTSRISGGKLAAYFNVRDQNVGRYADKLDALAKALTWEVNRIHSQGGGLKNKTHELGSYQVRDPNRPLGDPHAGLAFGDRLTEGNLTIQIYDKDGKAVLNDAAGNPMPTAVDFDPNTAGVQNFDPAKHSLADVTRAINNTYGGHVKADVIDGRLQLTAVAEGTSFNAYSESSGLLAGLGINTFFQGEDASSFTIDDKIRADVSYINTGKVNNHGQVAAGDNFIAKGMIDLSTKQVKISTTWENTTMTLGAYYGSTVGVVGAETRAAMVNSNYNGALAQDLDDRCSSISGVNLDEEMANLIKFQHSYTAAAKLITTADQMIQTLLSLKQ